MSAGLAEGEVLLGRFTLVRALDAEGASQIWIAEDADLSELVALRILDPSLAADPGLQARMLAACRRARQLRHPHIVPVFDFHRDGATCFLSREYIEGRNLSALGGRPVDGLVETLTPVLDALEYAHSVGVVHGNLKATKILVDHQGAARIADFLIAGALLDSVHPVPGAADDSARWMGEDLEALAAICQEFVTGLSGRMPSAQRQRDLGTLRRALAEASRAAIPGAPSATDAGREGESHERLIVPIQLKGASGREEGASQGRSRVGIAFAGLLVVALGVVFLLPRWVEPDAAPDPAGGAEPPTFSQPEADASPPTAPVDDGEARRLLAEVLGRRDSWRQRGVESWGEEALREAEAQTAAGEQAQLESDPATAVGHYRKALDAFDALEAAARERLSAALDAGAAALEGREVDEALRQYEAALGIDPGNPTATSGVQRAKTLEQVLSQMDAGARHEQEGDIEGAHAAYAQALEADPEWEPAREALARTQAALADSEYQRRIAQTVAALAANDLGTARKHVDAALALRPGSPEARDLGRRIDEKKLAVAVVQGRRRAQAFEATEEWRAAADEYRKMLELDEELTFAQEGFDRSDRRASMSEKFDAWIAEPWLLFDERASSEARALLDVARRVENPGPRLRAQIDRVSSLERAATTPVSVTFESDGVTEVRIQRVGALGAFARREIPLKPGTYVITGIRRGFRDVRQTVTVIPGRTPPTVDVRCLEKI